MTISGKEEEERKRETDTKQMTAKSGKLTER